jgi:glucose-1-phosphate adenylyltransferase
MKEVLSVILGGGRGTRLYPLTKYRAKPAVPLAGKYRLIDVPISNCLNSGMKKIFILTQFNSVSLNRHIFRAYKLDSFSEGFVEIIAAEQGMDKGDWFQGSADAVRKCLRHFSDPRIKYVLILSGDQLYKMNFSEVLKFHIERGSELTVACNTVLSEETPELGIMGIDKQSRIRKFVEKPKNKSQIVDMAVRIDGKTRYLASMGIYVFDKRGSNGSFEHQYYGGFRQRDNTSGVRPAETFAFIPGYWKEIGRSNRSTRKRSR